MCFRRNGKIEALALGIPVVSTDCPNGPAEILEGGKWGGLVPVGDPEALAGAMLGLLKTSPRDRVRVEQLERYTLGYAVSRYGEVMGVLG